MSQARRVLSFKEKEEREMKVQPTAHNGIEIELEDGDVFEVHDSTDGIGNHFIYVSSERKTVQVFGYNPEDYMTQILLGEDSLLRLQIKKEES